MYSAPGCGRFRALTRHACVEAVERGSFGAPTMIVTRPGHPEAEFAAPLHPPLVSFPWFLHWRG